MSPVTYIANFLGFGKQHTRFCCPADGDGRQSDFLESHRVCGQDSRSDSQQTVLSSLSHVDTLTGLAQLQFLMPLTASAGRAIFDKNQVRKCLWLPFAEGGGDGAVASARTFLFCFPFLLDDPGKPDC